MSPTERFGILTALAAKLASTQDPDAVARLRRTIDMHLDSLNRGEPEQREEAP